MSSNPHPPVMENRAMQMPMMPMHMQMPMIPMHMQMGMGMGIDHNSQLVLQQQALQNKPSKVAAVKWVKEWVPQETVLNNGKCYVLKWVTEDTLKAVMEKRQEKEQEQQREPTPPRIFLCSFEGCGKTFTEGGALKKHAHVHGEKQHICHYEGCGRKFLDSSKLKRHFLIHTGEKHFICPHEGCGKAFSLDFNLRAHMRTHSQENYHVCPFEECGKRYAHEYKLKAHIKSTHEKNLAHALKLTPPQLERESLNPKASTPAYGSATSDRPFVCPYEGCDKCYIHEYKLNLHLRREHVGYAVEENGKRESDSDDEMDQASDQDANIKKGVTGSGKGKLRLTSKTIPATNVQRKFIGVPTVDLNMNTNTRTSLELKELGKGGRQEDSEETEEDQDDTDNDGWGHGSESDDDEDDDEETEDDMD